jgi:GNAT superfamily N-acetyltransferase
MQDHESRGTGLVSCRIAADRMPEALMLQACGFCCIETMLRPELNLGTLHEPAGELRIQDATAAEARRAASIAAQAFGTERFHADPRLGPRLGHERYRRWVMSCVGHPRQRLLSLLRGKDLVAFFVVERQESDLCYWHLTAVDPACQGQGLGRQSWLLALHWARSEGCKAVASSIVARNVRVLNLYASLGFRFSAPANTYHWMPETGA